MGSDRARKDRIAKLAVEIWHSEGRSFIPKMRDVAKVAKIGVDRVKEDIVRWHSEGYHVWDIAEYIITRDENSESEGNRDVA